MGAIGLPFPNSDGGDDDDDIVSCEVTFGLVGRGVGRARVKKKTPGNGREGPSAAAGGVAVGCTPSKMKQHWDGYAISVSPGDSSSVLPALDLADRTFESRGGHFP